MTVPLQFASLYDGQPQRIISGLRETLIKRLIVERTSRARAKTGPEEQSGKAEKDRNRHKNRIARSGQARWVYVKNTNHNVPTT